ncbi:Uncharacterized protein PECH_000693 [Penicillium ucsense]|uniref:Microbial-type PARG catalytic domain-containing protein n=1 Tax=Penicillium ucsense TaxID=2839758 RepID=A0A8J8W2T6_9EURO|nr:Uncharacterized protein PECM_004956 [Penicillium ucsense]KAF7738418.1 Uncharacterized protein PECH_000693 [Penicillium ucsense]
MSAYNVRIKPWRYTTSQRPFPRNAREDMNDTRRLAAWQAQPIAKDIIDAYEGTFGINFKFTWDDVPTLDSEELSSKHPSFINGTTVKVINKDTLDTAIALEAAEDILEVARKTRVLVLNFANATTPGGSWKAGATAQEEQIVHRTTLIQHGLDSKLYPLKAKEGIYTSNVLVLRENENKGYFKMWIDRPERLPLISVVSVAAEASPALDLTRKKYAGAEQRERMENTMRSILRLAADHGHTRLVLGALGCGVFGHPPHEVADCWRRVLTAAEFKAWFDIIVFAVYDQANDTNFKTFHAILHDLEI